MDAALAATTVANTGTATPSDGYGMPSPSDGEASLGQGVQKYGRTTGSRLGTVAGTNVSVDVCYLVIFEFCLQEARFVGQISVSPGAFSLRRLRLADRHAGWKPARRVAVRGRGRADDRQPDRPDPPAVRRNDRRRSAGRRPARSPHRQLRRCRRWERLPLLECALLRRRLGDHRLPRLPQHQPGAESFLEGTGTGTSFVDSTAQNGTTYYYKVSAENELGEGPLSNEAQATPSDLVAPVSRSPTLDDFNRPDELPVSGGWSGAVGVNGSAEGCLKVVSNQLASNKTTTCTGWRSNTQYGPDTEVWTKIGVLPGARQPHPPEGPPAAGRRHGLRRLHAAHEPTLRSDEVALERIDNGVFVRLLTLDHELTAGDTLLLRVSGSIIEAWHNDGASWSRIGTTSDSTYAGPGYVGIGLRGLTGRLDDFGARGGSSTPPGAPTGLRARRRRERDPLLDGTDHRRRLGAHRLPHLSRHEPG